MYPRAMIVVSLVGLLALVFAAGIVLLLVFSRKPAGRGGGGGFGAGARFPPGTRAFESEMSLGIIIPMIEARESELLGQVDEARRAPRSWG